MKHKQYITVHVQVCDVLQILTNNGRIFTNLLMSVYALAIDLFHLALW